MSALKIWTSPNNFRVWKSEIAALIAGVDLEFPEFKFGETNKTPEFAKKNPLQKIPVLEAPQGCLFESQAILRHVARLRPESGLYGHCLWGAAQVDQWLDFCANELESNRAIWIYPLYGYLAYDQAFYESAKAEVAKVMGILNTHLGDNSFMVGNAITLADIALASALHGLYTQVMTPEFIKPFPHVNRWFTFLVHQPEFAKVMGKVEFAKEEKLAPNAGKKTEQKDKGNKDAAKDANKDKGNKDGGKDKGNKDGGKDKGNKDGGKDAAKDKDAKKKDKDENKAKEVDLEAAAAAEAEAAKKKKHPLDALPQSTMDLDATKRKIFAKKPIDSTYWDGSFYTDFDAAGYTWVRGEHKYNNENTQYFTTANAMTGFLQRAEGGRKYGLGVLHMTGVNEDTPPYRIVACFCIRGTDIAVAIDGCDDLANFTWTKLDVTKDAKAKEFVTQCMKGEGKIDGQEIIETKYFK